jgi:hypothetical protein
MAYGNEEKDDMGNKGRKGKGPKPMRGAKKARRESARKERRNLLTENPVVDKSSLGSGPTPKAKQNHASGSGTITMHTKSTVPEVKTVPEAKKITRPMQTKMREVPKPALKNSPMTATPINERNEMHATDFGKRSIETNPSIKVITNQYKKKD